MNVLELFAGIGGLAEAAAGAHRVVAAVDHDRRALDVYAANFPDHRREVKNLAYVTPGWLRAFDADLWWMSPPCAPHGVRGNREDLADPRSAAFVNVLRALVEVRPRAVALENVPGFAGSLAHAALREACDAAGLVHREEREICPTLLGIPGVRRRFYLVASREPLAIGPPPVAPVRLVDLLGPDDPALAVPAAVVERFGGAFHRVDPADPQAVAACFTRAYGTSPVYAGSYLVRGDGAGLDGVRYFAPEEIARLHGHRRNWSFAGLPVRAGWKLVGNGLSVPVVRWVLSWLGAHHDDQTTAGRMR
ncbi:MAG: DNA cytosine methyltransferase [Myxococcota bacterium]